MYFLMYILFSDFRTELNFSRCFGYIKKLLTNKLNVSKPMERELLTEVLLETWF